MNRHDQRAFVDGRGKTDPFHERGDEINQVLELFDGKRMSWVLCDALQGCTCICVCKRRPDAYRVYANPWIGICKLLGFMYCPFRCAPVGNALDLRKSIRDKYHNQAGMGTTQRHENAMNPGQCLVRVCPAIVSLKPVNELAGLGDIHEPRRDSLWKHEFGELQESHFRTENLVAIRTIEPVKEVSKEVQGRFPFLVVDRRRCVYRKD